MYIQEYVELYIREIQDILDQFDGDFAVGMIKLKYRLLMQEGRFGDYTKELAYVRLAVVLNGYVSIDDNTDKATWVSLIDDDSMADFANKLFKSTNDQDTFMDMFNNTIIYGGSPYGDWLYGESMQYHYTQKIKRKTFYDNAEANRLANDTYRDKHAFSTWTYSFMV